MAEPSNDNAEDVGLLLLLCEQAYHQRYLRVDKYEANGILTATVKVNVLGMWITVVSGQFVPDPQDSLGPPKNAS